MAFTLAHKKRTLSSHSNKFIAKIWINMLMISISTPFAPRTGFFVFKAFCDSFSVVAKKVVGIHLYETHVRVSATKSLLLQS